MFEALRLFPAFGPDKYVLSTGWDKKVQLWQLTLPTEEQVSTYIADQGRIQAEITKRKAKTKGGRKKPSAPFDPKDLEPKVAAPATYFKIDKKISLTHHSKINSATTAADGRIWIGDVSSDITLITCKM